MSAPLPREKAIPCACGCGQSFYPSIMALCIVDHINHARRTIDTADKILYSCMDGAFARGFAAGKAEATHYRKGRHGLRELKP